MDFNYDDFFKNTGHKSLTQGLEEQDHGSHSNNQSLVSTEAEKT